MKLEELARIIDPKNTVLLFGAGSSLPSGAPSVAKIIEAFSQSYGLQHNNYTLGEVASLAEIKVGRGEIVRKLRELFANLHPAGGLNNLPLYNWKSIFTTNYDDLIEQAYRLRQKNLRVYDSNFDFISSNEYENCTLFKVHGTIDKDISDGSNSRIILSDSDYEHTEAYREYLYDRLKGDLAGANLLIIGHSLADEDIKAVVKRAAAINAKLLVPSRICLLMYSHDEQRASLIEKRGITVAFGGIDEFFAAMSPQIPTVVSKDLHGRLLSKYPSLEPITIELTHAPTHGASVSAMFNGKPASYSDIAAGYTFRRRVSEEIAAYVEEDASLCATLLGASGVGKTTAVRQALTSMREAGFLCYEHKGDHSLSASQWHALADDLRNDGLIGALFVDDAHHHLQSINDLIDKLVQSDNGHLKIILCSSRNHWYPRIKTPNIYKFGKTLMLSKLTVDEIERLLNLIDNSKEVRSLVEGSFGGFNREERRRRLIVRFESDMFVCLRNIFANDSFDNIVLLEYADLDEPLQDIYRYVAAMENAGVRVHRQLIIRLLGLHPQHIGSILDNLTDIVSEYDIDEKLSIYGWRCRHSVIASIITKYKFQDLEKTIAMFEMIIDNISPTYDIELRSLRDICNVETGISRIPDKNTQNRLLRKMMSSAPGERVPRHRLIRNLIDQGFYAEAETEIRLFDKDFGSDGPVHRYKIKLMVERAVRTKGLLKEDRIAILEQAHGLAIQGIARYQTNKSILSAYAELGVEYYKLTGNYKYFDDAIIKLQVAEEKLGDPQIAVIISHFQRRIAGHIMLEINDSDVAVIAD